MGPLLREWVIKAKIPLRSVTKHSRVCGRHFVGGSKSSALDVPVLFPWTPPSRKPPLARSCPAVSATQSPIARSSSDTLALPVMPPVQPEITLPVTPPADQPEMTLTETVEHDHTYSLPPTCTQISKLTGADHEVLAVKSP